MLFTVFELEPESQQESQYAEAGENQHRNRVVVAYVFTGFDLEHPALPGLLRVGRAFPPPVLSV